MLITIQTATKITNIDHDYDIYCTKHLLQSSSDIWLLTCQQISRKFEGLVYYDAHFGNEQLI